MVSWLVRKDLLQGLLDNRLELNLIHGTRFLMTQSWSIALETAKYMMDEGLVLDQICWNALVTCCPWQHALKWTMDQRGSSALIAQCGRGGCWQQASQVFFQQPAPDLVTRNALLSAWHKAKRWQRAVDLFGRSPAKRFDSFSFVSSISAIPSWCKASMFLEDMRNGRWNVASNLKALNSMMSIYENFGEAVGNLFVFLLNSAKRKINHFRFILN